MQRWFQFRIYMKIDNCQFSDICHLQSILPVRRLTYMGWKVFFRYQACVKHSFLILLQHWNFYSLSLTMMKEMKTAMMRLMWITMTKWMLMITLSTSQGKPREKASRNKAWDSSKLNSPTDDYHRYFFNSDYHDDADDDQMFWSERLQNNSPW